MIRLPFLFLSYLIFLRVFLLLFHLFLKLVSFVFVYFYLFQCFFPLHSLSSLPKSSYISSYKPFLLYDFALGIYIFGFFQYKKKILQFLSLCIFSFSVPSSFFKTLHFLVFLTFSFLSPFPVFFPVFLSVLYHYLTLLSPSLCVFFFYIIFAFMPLACFPTQEGKGELFWSSKSIPAPVPERPELPA